MALTGGAGTLGGVGGDVQSGDVVDVSNGSGGPITANITYQGGAGGDNAGGTSGAGGSASLNAPTSGLLIGQLGSTQADNIAASITGGNGGAGAAGGAGGGALLGNADIYGGALTGLGGVGPATVTVQGGNGGTSGSARRRRQWRAHLFGRHGRGWRPQALKR